jgi:hypothetical protein
VDLELVWWVTKSKCFVVPGRIASHTAIACSIIAILHFVALHS